MFLVFFLIIIGSSSHVLDQVFAFDSHFAETTTNGIENTRSTLCMEMDDDLPSVYINWLNEHTLYVTMSINYMNSHRNSNSGALADMIFVVPFYHGYYPADNMLTGLCGRLCSLKPLNSAKDRKKLTLLYLSMLCLMQSGDTELNPGPEFPCKICNLECDWSKSAVQCEKCEIWYHANCMYMNSHVYRALEDSDVSWICCQCGMPSFSSSLFSSRSTVLSNSFSTLHL